MEKGDSIATVEAVTDFIAGPQYYLSSDNTVLLMMLQPSVSMNEFEDMMILGYQIDDSLEVIRKLYPDLNFGRTGLMMMQIAKTMLWSKIQLAQCLCVDIYTAAFNRIFW
jgi:hypothetical protein